MVKSFVAIALVALQTSVYALTDRSISPVISYYQTGSNGTAIGAESAGEIVTITNDHTTLAMSIGTFNFSGDSSEYKVSANNCGISIAAGTSCTLEVKYTPTQFGSRIAYVTVDTTLNGVTEKLTAYFSNDEDTFTEAKRRLPAVLNVLKIYEGADTSGVLLDTAITPLTAGQQYTISWTLLGYGNVYDSIMIGYDCTVAQVTDESCAASGSPDIDSTILTPVSTEASTWTFSGKAANYYAFEATFTAPSTVGNVLALRFYNRADGDIPSNKPETSLLIPGNLARIAEPESGYIGSEGRRVFFNIQAAP